MDQLHKQYLCHTNVPKLKSSNTKGNDDDSTKTNTFDLSDNIKLTTDCNDCSEDGLACGGVSSKLTVKECDRNKLCPVAKNLSRMTSKERNETAATSKTCSRQDSDEWTDDDEDGSMSDSGTTTVSSCSSNATPKSSPKKSPLLANKVKVNVHREMSPK
jgi:hypothetical protein